MARFTLTNSEIKLFSCINIRAVKVIQLITTLFWFCEVNCFSLNNSMSSADWREREQIEYGANNRKLKMLSASLQTIIILLLCFLSAGGPLHRSLSKLVIFFSLILTFTFCLSHLSSCTSDVISVFLFEICFPIYPTYWREDFFLSFFFFTVTNTENAHSWKNTGRNTVQVVH